MDLSSGMAREYEFLRFIEEIIERSPDIEPTTTHNFKGPDHGFDIAAIRNGQTLLIEIKLTTPQIPSRLEKITARLKAAAESYKTQNRGIEPDLVITFPGVLSQSKMTQALTSGVQIWDGPLLRAMADSLGIEAPPFVAFAGPQSSGTDALGAHSLIQRLRAIAPGSTEWSAYEKYCEDLLNFLFVPPLNLALPQSRDERNAKPPRRHSTKLFARRRVLALHARSLPGALYCRRSQEPKFMP